MSYFVWVDVEATDEHSARDQALRRAGREQSTGVWGEEPQVTVVIEGETAEYRLENYLRSGTLLK
jgi:hypothetical protein